MTHLESLLQKFETMSLFKQNFYDAAAHHHQPTRRGQDGREVENDQREAAQDRGESLSKPGEAARLDPEEVRVKIQEGRG